MPYTIAMQDWVRIHGSGSSTTTVQDEANWLDIGGFQGLTPWIEVGFFGGSPVLSLETSPTRDDAYFKQMSDASANSSSWSITTSGLQTGIVGVTATILSFNWTNSVLPPGKWLRWKITGGSNWRAMFKITLTAAQGRGGSFKHASLPLPAEAKTHPDDHTHAAQALLRARAAGASPSQVHVRASNSAAARELHGRVGRIGAETQAMAMKLLSRARVPSSAAEATRLYGAVHQMNAAVLTETSPALLPQAACATCDDDCGCKHSDSGQGNHGLALPSEKWEDSVRAASAMRARRTSRGAQVGPVPMISATQMHLPHRLNRPHVLGDYECYPGLQDCGDGGCCDQDADPGCCDYTDPGDGAVGLGSGGGTSSSGGGGSSGGGTEAGQPAPPPKPPAVFGQGSSEFQVSAQGVESWCRENKDWPGCNEIRVEEIEATVDQLVTPDLDRQPLDQHKWCRWNPGWPGCFDELENGRPGDALGLPPRNGIPFGDYYTWCSRYSWYGPYSEDCLGEADPLGYPGDGSAPGQGAKKTDIYDRWAGGESLGEDTANSRSARFLEMVREILMLQGAVPPTCSDLVENGGTESFQNACYYANYDAFFQRCDAMVTAYGRQLQDDAGRGAPALNETDIGNMCSTVAGDKEGECDAARVCRSGGASQGQPSGGPMHPGAPPWTFYRNPPVKIKQEESWTCWAAALSSKFGGQEPYSQDNIIDAYATDQDGSSPRFGSLDPNSPKDGWPHVANELNLSWERLGSIAFLKAGDIAQHLRDDGYVIVIFNLPNASGGIAAAHALLIYAIGYFHGDGVLWVAVMDPGCGCLRNIKFSDLKKNPGGVIVAW